MNEIVRSEAEESIPRNPLIHTIEYDEELDKFFAADSELDAEIVSLYSAEINLASADLVVRR